MNEHIVEMAVREALEEHIEEKGLVTGPDRLIERILSKLGLSDDYAHGDWKIERVPGDSPRWKGSRLRGANKSSFGYICTHQDGRSERFEPTDGVPPNIEIVRKSLDLFDRLTTMEAKIGNGPR